MAENRIEKDTMGEIAVAGGSLLGSADPAFAEIFPGRGGAGHDAERAYQSPWYPEKGRGHGQCRAETFR